MLTKLAICFCICLVVFLGSIAGFTIGVKFTESKEFSVSRCGTLIANTSLMFIGLSMAGMAIFAVKLFVFYLYGIA